MFKKDTLLPDMLKANSLNKNWLNKALLIATTASILSACDSGGSSGTPAPAVEEEPIANVSTEPDPNETEEESDTESEPETILTGQFIDSAVKGLYYQTPSQSGLTNDDGEFSYIEGETVSFHIGSIKLGSAEADELLTPFSLSGIQAFTAENKILKSLAAENVNGFDRASNIANLLQSLDVDGNPDNGIDLGTAHELLADSSLDMSVKALGFSQALADSGLLGTLDLSHRRSLSEVLSHLYESLNLTIESSQVSSFSSTSGRENDGSVSYEYDESGIVTSQNTDTNNDGVADSVTSYEYDADGNLTRMENSETERVELMYYNDANQLIGRSVSSPNTGNTVTEVLSYSGNKLSRLEVEHQNQTQVSSYSYGSNDQLSAVNIDKNNDGENDQKFEFKYVNGQISSFKDDRDGEAGLEINYDYDGNGNRTTHRIDTDQDGEADVINTFSYDANNHLTRYEQDQDLDGTADYIEDYIHDSLGNRTRYRKDTDADGTWDFIAQYSYDENGRRTKMVEDSDGNGLADKIWERAYQATDMTNSWEQLLSRLL